MQELFKNNSGMAFFETFDWYADKRLATILPNNAFVLDLFPYFKLQDICGMTNRKTN